MGRGGGCDVLKPVFKGSAEPRLGFEPAPLFNRLRTPSELFTARSNQLAQQTSWLHTRPLLPPSSTVPAGSPSRGGDVTVHVPDTTSPAFLLHSPCGLTFKWWGCHGSCPRHDLFCLPPPQSPRAHLHVVGMSRFMFQHKPTELAHSFLFFSRVYFCLYGPFNCISFHTFSRPLSAFSLCSSGLGLPYLFFELYVSL